MTKKNRVATIVAACIVIAAGVTGSVYAAVTVAHDKEEAESSTVVTTQAETSTEATTEAVTEVVTTTPATTTTTAPATQTETTTEAATETTTIEAGTTTRERFLQIKSGMSYSEICEFLGTEGIHMQDNDGGRTVYYWRISDDLPYRGIALFDADSILMNKVIGLP